MVSLSNIYRSFDKNVNVFYLVKFNIVVQYCKFYNDVSCNLSQDGIMLVIFVSSYRGFFDDNIMVVYSFELKIRGQCFFIKSFGKYFILIYVIGECNLQGGYIILVIYVYWNYFVTLFKFFDKNFCNIYLIQFEFWRLYIIVYC